MFSRRIQGTILFVISAALLWVASHAARWGEKFATPFEAPKPTPRVGEWLGGEGSVDIKSFANSKFLPLTKGESLGHLDSLRMPPRSRGQFRMGGHEMELLGPALMILERWDPVAESGPIYIHLVLGELRTLKAGKAGEVFVLQGGRLQDPSLAGLARKYQIPRGLRVGTLSPPREAPAPNPNQTASDVTPPATNSDSVSADLTKTLTDSEIDEYIARYASDFQRCQANALRDGREAKGQILVGLRIGTDGRISEASIMNSEIADDTIKRCVLQVFDRVRLRAFSGAEIQRTYPISFE